jgi:condensin-2 complex subunit G2
MCVQTVVDDRVQQRQEQQQQVEALNDGTTASSKKVLKMLPQVFDVASDLHDVLFALHACDSKLEPNVSLAKNAIIGLCESWYLANGEYKESLIVQCLPLLVLKACEDPDCFTSKSHIQRLYKLRQAFHCIDFAEPSSDSLRQLLLRVTSNPLCLKLVEGRKFLASLLQDVDLVQDLHLAFRAQIPEAKKSILEAYGEIYHRAWKEVKDDDDDDYTEDDNDADDSADIEEKSMSIRQTIEHKVLQDLMHSAIHVAIRTTVQSILTVLEPFHSDKKNKDVASLLYRLYSPILWRSLAATNPEVRRNAVHILQRVFPLQNPAAPISQNSTKDAVLKGTSSLQVALKDIDPIVRVAASEATANICAMFWEALPPPEIRSLLNRKYYFDKGAAAAALYVIVRLKLSCSNYAALKLMM